MANYFIFCEFYECFAPRAAMIPLDNLLPEMQTAFNNLIALGTKMEMHYEYDPQRKGRVRKLVGYKINGELDKSQETYDTMKYWLHVLSDLENEHMYENDYPEDVQLCDIKSIKNVKPRCSPNEFFDVLSSSTEMNDIKVNIVSCVMASHVPFDTIKPLELSFICIYDDINKKATSDTIHQHLTAYNKFSQISCSKKGDGTFIDRGYVTLNNNDDYSLLYRHYLKIDDIAFYFD